MSDEWPDIVKVARDTSDQVGTERTFRTVIKAQSLLLVLADEIERLRGERDKLAEVLRKYMEGDDKTWLGLSFAGKAPRCPCSICHAARKALASLPPKQHGS